MDNTWKFKKLKEMEGKTIKSVEQIKAEYGRTFNAYICIVFTDDTKTLIHGGVPHQPNPIAEDMSKAPKFFTPDEIAERVKKDEQKKRRLTKEREDAERKEYERLKNKYET